MSQVKSILNFMVEVEQLKSVIRNTKPVGLDRYENAAEHSWHVSLMALLLSDYADEDIDQSRVIKMLLIHDLAEMVVGDTLVYEAQNEQIQVKEANAIKAIFAKLPEDLEKELTYLWQEFEAGVSKDAKFAKAIDRIPPLLHNIHGDGHSWKKHQISKERVLSFNKERIQAASHPIWNAVEEELTSAIEQGILR